MFRIGLIALLLVWACLTGAIIVSLLIAPFIPAKGTILLTYNIFLDRHERFELIDINQQIRYSFTPDVDDGTLAVSLAPRGRRMAVLSFANQQFSLSITDYAGNILTEAILSNYALDFEEVRWSSDGRYFMFYDALRSQIATIFILDTHSGDMTEITSFGSLNPSASWSADRQYIAYTDILENETISQIWIADANGQNRQQLTHNTAASYCPTWSPDGQTIAYIESVEDGDYLRYINTDGTDNLDYFSDILQMTTCPLWSSDGQFISFVSLNLNTYQTQVVLLDVITGEESQILDVEQTVSLQLWR